MGRAGGRCRPTAMVANRKMVACSEMAMTGTAAHRQSRVRHQMTATTIAHTPITTSVLPKRENSQLTGSQKSVRRRLKATARASSRWSRPVSVRVMSRPTPTTRPQSATPGATARMRRSARSCR